jgi:transposase InsO family protein
VGYSIDARMTPRPAVDALRHALALRRPVGTVVHSDRGSQFRSHAYVHTLRGHRLRGSMGRVGACADNAAMESFSAPLTRPDRPYPNESTEVCAVPAPWRHRKRRCQPEARTRVSGCAHHTPGAR